LTQEELAQRVGTDRSTISNALRLLRLPEPIKLAMSSGALSMGHARALLALGDETDLRRAAEKVMNEALSVREVEQLVQRLKGKKVIQKERVRDGSVQLRHVVEKLQRKLGAKVALRDRDGAGTVEIRYHSHGARRVTAVVPAPDARLGRRRVLTFRAVATAMFVAVIVGGAYRYVVLKIGYGPNISVVSAFFGYLALAAIGFFTGIRGTRWE